MLTIPKNALEAAKLIEKLAKESNQSVFIYCKERNIHSSLLNQWKKRKRGYDGQKLFQLIQKI